GIIIKGSVRIMQKEHTIIVGAGPCGLSCAIALKKKGITPLIIEKGNVVHTLYHYPTHQTFFSTSEKLEIGGIPFITEKPKPVRLQALAYYREVARRKALRINAFEKVTEVSKETDAFNLKTNADATGEKYYRADNIILATGYYDQPNHMDIPGEELDKVSHYVKEGHPYFNKQVAVIGGKNSAVDATLELHKAGAHITVLYRGGEYSKSIKPWILPEFASLVKKDIVHMEFNSHVTHITQTHLSYQVDGKTKTIPNDYVFAMTGYQPDQDFFRKCGIDMDEITGSPIYNEQTMETNIPGLYVASVVAAVYNNNKIFIENGRFHGEYIAESIMKSENRSLSRKSYLHEIE